MQKLSKGTRARAQLKPSWTRYDGCCCLFLTQPRQSVPLRAAALFGKQDRVTVAFGSRRRSSSSSDLASSSSRAQSLLHLAGAKPGCTTLLPSLVRQALGREPSDCHRALHYSSYQHLVWEHQLQIRTPSRRLGG